MVRFNGASHGCPGPRRCSHGLEHGRSRRDPRRQRAATDRHSQPCHSSRLNLRRGQRHLPARTNLTWCKAHCGPVRRLKPLLTLRRMRCSSICSPLLHPAWMRLMPRFSLEFPTGHKRPQASSGVNSWRTKSSPRGPVMVSTPWSPPPGGSGPGVWVPTPPAFLPYLLPQWGFVAPFAISSSSHFRPPGPPSLDSEQYAADYNEVKELGAAVGSTRTEDQTQIALFWADGAGTETPPGHWNSIAQIIAAAQGNTLGRKRKAVRLTEHRRGRRCNLRLGCQVCLPLLAPGYRD
jgi:hypothetical protein